MLQHENTEGQRNANQQNDQGDHNGRTQHGT